MILPWYIFLFIGAFDWGFYSHALISTESAARVAVLYTSSNSSHATDSTGACQYALRELQAEVNLSATITCPATALPAIVTATEVTGPDGQPAAQVAVTYQTQQLIPIPGLLSGQATIYRVVQMRL
jgi:uncharacterized protein YjdB